MKASDIFLYASGSAILEEDTKVISSFGGHDFGPASGGAGYGGGFGGEGGSGCTNSYRHSTMRAYGNAFKMDQEVIWQESWGSGGGKPGIRGGGRIWIEGNDVKLEGSVNSQVFSFL